ncbi:hypothetical protein M441DRAFT_406747 [Trichoderma asperellum CBS 433.97]|uniref:Uncharacterized protein n=1 Tax=Trichoderma asperellum (strain ATCC 204424 / CBS 433.97 / NBRC 101777) TaxID=1042311 RepID=A0A2T3Z6M6_TRIA4|nr:hypothetical protein M441DRAFT_406747 [Trichoderma asperellum CBS 433.97]PTB40467.1 hypothetical protein M441DRAFT_406747 [Trichoderma asperellum CBS 433.97]
MERGGQSRWNRNANSGHAFKIGSSPRRLHACGLLADRTVVLARSMARRLPSALSAGWLNIVGTSDTLSCLCCHVLVLTATCKNANLTKRWKGKKGGRNRPNKRAQGRLSLFPCFSRVFFTFFLAFCNATSRLAHLH